MRHAAAANESKLHLVKRFSSDSQTNPASTSHRGSHGTRRTSSAFVATRYNYCYYSTNLIFARHMLV